MRHNPFWAAAAALAHSGVLGRLRHMDLANHAAGLSLPAEHWFWDKQKSGGIWIEHGVHFFDAFAWVSMQVGEVICARSYERADGAIDRVEGLFHFGEVAAHCYHAFDQSGQTEQTTVYLTFERGYVTLREWVPTSLELLTPVSRSAWQAYLPGEVEYKALPQDLTDARAYAPEGKSVLYRQGIQAGMRNLAEAVRDPGVRLTVTGEHGLVSLTIAAAAEAFSA
jgi:predicted dehydrogenase